MRDANTLMSPITKGSQDDNLLLNDSIVNGLKNVGQKKFSSVSSPSTDLDSSFWDTCACFLPTQYYNNYLENNNLEDKSLGTQECWFLPCSTASIQSQEVSPGKTQNHPDTSRSNFVETDNI